MRHGAIRATLVAVGAASMVAAPRVGAQRPLPRVVTAPIQPRAPHPVARAAESPPHQVPDPRFPSSVNDPRFPTPVPDPRFPRSANDQRNDPRSDPRYGHPSSWDGRRQRRGPNSGGSTVIILPPGGYGYDNGYAQGSYYGSGGYGGVYDVNGRPLSAQLEPAASSDGYAFTPDMSGSPYVVTEEGMMVVDFADRARRAFPSCAGQSSIRDPEGRPRTIFYQSTDYWMVLKPGQRGRVQGAPDKDVAACYAIDSVGRVVLRY